MATLPASSKRAVATLPWHEDAILPRLPVPPLEHTLTLYLRSAMPLSSEAEFKHTALCVIKALTEKQEAREGAPITLAELHRRLQERAAGMYDRSWLIDWWNDMMYTSWRLPLPINVSYWYLFEDKVFEGVDARGPSKAAGRGAALLIAAARFRDLVYEHRLPAEGADGARLDTSMYRYIFHACRLPRVGNDGVRVYDGIGPTAPSDTVVVMRQGRLFLVSLTERDASTGVTRRASFDTLAKRLQAVLSAVPATVLAPTLIPGVGMLTAAHRDTWAHAFLELVGPEGAARPSHGVNIPAHPSRETSALPSSSGAARNLQIITAIESSLCVLVLESGKFETIEEKSRLLLHGYGNSWFDKASQFVVADDGTAGYVGEHSHSDGMPTANMVAWATAHVKKGGALSASADDGARVISLQASIPEHNRVSVPESSAFAEMVFDETDRLHGYIRKAAGQHAQAVAAHELCVVRSRYGRDTAKRFGVSPDAWAQMAIQLAHHRWKGHGVGTYEPAHTRRFLWGRTACIRVASAESAAWVRSMDQSDASPSHRMKLLQRAGAAHVEYSKAAASGMDLDRHLLGLRVLASDATTRGEKLSPAVDALLSDPVCTRSRTWMISTSNLTVPTVRNWGWGEVVEGGLGVAYSTQSVAFSYNIVAETSTRPCEFARELERALQTMADTCELALPSKALTSK